MSAEQPDLFQRSRLLPRRPVFDADPFGRHGRFDGATFDAALDTDRLTRQLDAVRRWMLTHGCQSLAEIAAGTGFPEASVSARLRDLRKARFGGFTVERHRRSAGTWEYLVLPNLGDAA